MSVTSITGTLPNLAPNLQAALEKVQDDVDFYSLLEGMGQKVSDASGNPLYWSDNRVHNLSADNCLGIKFGDGYEPAGQNLVYSGTLSPDQVAAVNAGKPIDFASSGGDYVLHLDPSTGGVTCTPASTGTSAPEPPPIAPVKPMDQPAPQTDSGLQLPEVKVARTYPDQMLNYFGAGHRQHSSHRV